TTAARASSSTSSRASSGAGRSSARRGLKAAPTRPPRITAPITAMERLMSMADRDGKIWMDGTLVEWRDAKIHVLTHTLHYGCGAFEGVRAYDTVDGTAILDRKSTRL